MGLIRLIFRIAATLALAVAVILVVLDATRSIADNALVTTPLGSAWEAFSPQTFDALREGSSSVAPYLWDPAALAVLALPGFLVFLVVALVFFMLGRTPRRRTVPLRG